MSAELISVEEAKQMIAEHVEMLPKVQVPVTNAVGLTLAADLYAPFDIPAYPQSSMDGYAINFDSIGKAIRVKGESAAGADEELRLQPGEAVRIFTGAPVPQGADTIIVQEKAITINGILAIDEHVINRHQHVRQVGSEIAKGGLAAAKGHWLSAASIGFLAGAGFAQLPVHPLPKVHVIVTGNELQTPGLPLLYGQVYESNSAALLAVLQQFGIGKVTVSRVGDDAEKMSGLLRQALQYADMVLMTGGVSVGAYDFTRAACEDNGVRVVFHKIRQKPGKPILFGVKNGTPVFGLPGNPASVLTCFYEYVTLAIQQMTGVCMVPVEKQLPCISAYKKPEGITHFLKASVRDNAVTLLEGQESYKLNSFAYANALVVLPAQKTNVEPGEMVAVHMLH